MLCLCLCSSFVGTKFLKRQLGSWLRDAIIYSFLNCVSLILCDTLTAFPNFACCCHMLINLTFMTPKWSALFNKCWSWNDDPSQIWNSTTKLPNPPKIKKNVEQPSLNLTFHQCSQPSNVHPANFVAFFQSSPRPKPSRRCRHPRHTTQRWGRDNRTPPDCHDPPRHGLPWFGWQWKLSFGRCKMV